MKPEWQFSDIDDYGYLKTDRGYASITKTNEWEWHWEVHDDDDIDDINGWYGCEGTIEEAILCAEKKLK